MAWWLALLIGCDMGPDVETLVDELTVLGLAGRPPEVAPGDLLSLDVLVVDPENQGFDLMVWLCTAQGGPCLEAGPTPRPLDQWTAVVRGAPSESTVSFTVPLEFGAILPSQDVSAAFLVWALACAPGACGVMAEVEAAPEAGSPAWSGLIDRLADPTGLLDGTTFQTANLAFRTLIFSGRPPELRNLPPTLLRVGDAPLVTAPGGELILEFTTADATLLWPYTTGGGFEFRRYDVAEGATSMRWLAPDDPGTYELVVFAEDELGGEVWWRGAATVE